MNKGDWITFSQRPAAIDHFLTATLHLRVLTLNRCEVQLLVALSAAHRRRRAATQTDQHCGTAKHNEISTRFKIALLDVFFTDVAEAAGDHDRLVIAPHGVTASPLKGSKIAGEIWPAKFVVKRRRADGSVKHDLQRRHNAIRSPVIELPGLINAGDI